MQDVNFIHNKFLNAQDESFILSVFGPVEEHEEVVFFDDTWKLEDIWVFMGLFTSKNQARKNGHGGQIDDGFTFTITKKKRNMRVTILNKFEE